MTKKYADLCLAEYGVPATCAGARVWQRVSHPRLPRPIRSAGEYVAACRRLDPSLSPEGGWRVDGRLVACGYGHVPPSEWIQGERRDGREPRRLDDFVRFWSANAGNPSAVGSCYNADPDVAFRVWSRPRLRRVARVMPAEHMGWLLGRDRRARTFEAARAMRRASARGVQQITPHVAYLLGHLSPEAQWAALDDVELRADARRLRALGHACTPDRRACDERTEGMVIISTGWWGGPGRYRVSDATDTPRCDGRGTTYPLTWGVQRVWRWGPVRASDLDWTAASEAEAALQAAPVAALRAAEVPSDVTLAWAEDGPTGRRIRLCLALRERGWVSTTRPHLWSYPQEVFAQRVLSAGIAVSLAPWHTSILHDDEIVSALPKAIHEGKIPAPDACKSHSSLLEWLHAEGYGYAYGQVTPMRREARGHLRSLDRAAQRCPELAIRDYRAEYDRGQRLEPVLRQVIDHVLGLLDTGRTVVVHGRDGELIYQLALRSGADRRRLRYAITSRSLTTHRDDTDPRYLQYLGRTVPRSAVHVDTGFAGSIPRWFGTRGWRVESIRLVSASRPEDQMPVNSFGAGDLREIVLRDLEHSAQRLECPSAWPPAYSHEAPGFWARVYGAADAMGLPRRI